VHCGRVPVEWHHLHRDVRPMSKTREVFVGSRMALGSPVHRGHLGSAVELLGVVAESLPLDRAVLGFKERVVCTALYAIPTLRRSSRCSGRPVIAWRGSTHAARPPASTSPNGLSLGGHPSVVRSTGSLGLGLTPSLIKRRWCSSTRSGSRERRGEPRPTPLTPVGYSCSRNRLGW
jgi:hypothetical protein